jgi:hypothetical protein
MLAGTGALGHHKEERSMNEQSVAQPRVVYMHGDFVEEFHVHDYEGAEPQTGYLCRACDLILPAEHFKQHPRAVHMARYKSDFRRLLRLAARGPIVRGCDPEDNLVERAIWRERQRDLHAQGATAAA